MIKTQSGSFTSSNAHIRLDHHRYTELLSRSNLSHFLLAPSHWSSTDITSKALKKHLDQCQATPPVSSHCTLTCQESVDHMEASYRGVCKASQGRLQKNIWNNARPPPSRFVTLAPNLPGISRSYGGIIQGRSVKHHKEGFKKYLNQCQATPLPGSASRA